MIFLKLFFTIPKSQTAPVYLRIYDADTGGELDEVDAGWDTRWGILYMAVKGPIAIRMPEV